MCVINMFLWRIAAVVRLTDGTDDCDGLVLLRTDGENWKTFMIHEEKHPIGPVFSYHMEDQLTEGRAVGVFDGVSEGNNDFEGVIDGVSVGENEGESWKVWSRHVE